MSSLSRNRPIGFCRIVRFSGVRFLGEAAFHACKDISWAKAQLYTKEVLPWAI